MINQNSLKTVENATFSKQFCRPLYESYCFSRIPKTIEKLFIHDVEGALPDDVYTDPGQTFEHVVVLFLDGFGWNIWEKYKRGNPFLDQLESRGVLSKLTSLFPSTTAAHVTCINTGLTPSQSGIYEWFIYEPFLNALIAPLLFSFAGDKKPETLKKTGFSPENLYPQKTLYQSLQSKKVQSFVVQPKAISHTIPSHFFFRGADVLAYETFQQGLENVLTKLKPKTYAYVYFPDFDSIGHRKGIYSVEFSKAIEKAFKTIETFFKRLPKNTACILTADHGMCEVSPKRTYYLNDEIQNIEKYLLFGANKKPLAPAGSCRDFFLHVHKDRLYELKEVLSHFLEGKADLYTTEEFIDSKMFGPQEPEPNFLRRVGNLIITPYEKEAIWWHEKGRFEQNFYAAHGGLTREEIEIPFFFLPIT